MPRPKLVVLGIIALVVSAAAVRIETNMSRQHAEAERALPAAVAYLRGDPTCADVQVEVSDYHGGGLWFTGSMPTQAACDRLEAELGQRFGSTEFEFMFTVLSRQP